MRLDELDLAAGRIHLNTLPGQVAVVCAQTAAEGWAETARTVRAAGGQLIAVWGSETIIGMFSVSAAYALDDGILWVRLPVGAGCAPNGADGYPDLSGIFPGATRMQRTVYDMVGLCALGAEDVRPWLNHGNWPADYFPLRKQASGNERFEAQETDYPFVPVEGDGVHEIAVGPIHAGVIEPGHFRFSVVGEKVLRLEERLGYAHRGVERLFERAPALLGHRIAARIAGDSTVAFSWAYCMALEQALGVAVPVRALWLRALMLERERIANHLGDLGALGNDAGFAFGLAQFSRLKEDWVRLNERIFGHRYLMERIVPGGVARDVSPEGMAAIVHQGERMVTEVRAMQRIYEEQSGLQDRFAGTGRLSAEVAEHFGVCGLAGRASGGRSDVRVSQRHAPYDTVPVNLVSDERGDVAARVAVRFGEIEESVRLISTLLQGLPGGNVAVALGEDASPARGAGWIEGWRGDVFVALEVGAAGSVSRCHCHDPSWQNWPALEHAIIGNIVPDFPLINKSFNLSYAGHDL